MAPFGPGDWARIAMRGAPLGLLVFGGLACLLLVRLVERPLFGPRRPVTPWITRGVCSAAFVCLGMRRRACGRPLVGEGAAVANHASWLDIFALNAGDAVYFVAKAEVAGWAGIGWLARATGTLFIRRNRGDAAAQTRRLRKRLEQNHRLLFFPEGTSTDGRRVLPFKPTLFAPFFADHLKDELQVQPITVKYTAPMGEDPRFYGWWGDMEFGTHLLRILAVRRPGSVEVIYHPPLRVAAFPGRKALAQACEAQVRTGLEA
ncbi:MAG: lysophospholipid acyltransferase family protein [Pseudomonadota bacterium]